MQIPLPYSTLVLSAGRDDWRERTMDCVYREWRPTHWYLALLAIDWEIFWVCDPWKPWTVRVIRR